MVKEIFQPLPNRHSYISTKAVIEFIWSLLERDLQRKEREFGRREHGRSVKRNPLCLILNREKGKIHNSKFRWGLKTEWKTM